MKTQCPGCQGKQLTQPWVVPGQPAVLNYRCHSHTAATKVPLLDLHLVECHECGLVFNAGFDESLVPYDGGYDNQQSHSSVFWNHMEECARHLATHYAAPAGSGIVLEPGCGKGAYLKMLCKLTGWRGLGYDTTSEAAGEGEHNTHFVNRNASTGDIPTGIHALVCRHVIEHVGDVGAFLRLLHEMAVAGGAKVTYIETPSWEWIVAQAAFWDVFHEHCNYFTAATLQHLAKDAGFHVLEHFTTFGGQYQSLYLGTSDTFASRDRAQPSPSELDAFARKADAAKATLQSHLVVNGAGRGPYAIWGAGAKGVTLANTFTHLGMAPSIIIDSNPGKAGTFIPGVAVPVHPPGRATLEKVPLIVIPNPNYLPEIQETLRNLGLNPTLVSI
ncbi:class I SAM-dependent methyltransferase [Roseimicrobium sp. ORNL1]|uniref:class I SAM-dependent methyltransferase n=1 Tax=Roseimicrobium sp. ORNL1 TaxID=2711231 RepID=UPI0013E14FFB|nr:class I SAM-dependent methyltransferase [Roseimicrobium sp. ORNL1]QIF03684.1 methyltransferase domain-containing protein [Roseimicrobium sp. ORNL1]